MTNARIGSVGSIDLGYDLGLDDEGPFFAWVPPEDRLWRHPSEVPDGHPGGTVAAERPGPDRLPAPNLGPARIWTVAIVAGVIGAVAASGIGILGGEFQQPTTVVQSVFPSTPSVSLANASGPNVDWTTVDNAVAPSVVAISVSTADGPEMGSGLLILSGGSARAYVITDLSLISSAADTDELGPIEVTFLSGRQAKGRLVGQDPLSGLALIAVSGGPDTFPTLGSVAQLAVANPVMAIGARTVPGGSVFSGSVTAENRNVPVADGTDMENMIAVSGTSVPAPVAGGPLVDQFGQVVGITLALDPTDTSDQDLTFAVPVDEAEHVAQQILAGKTVTHPWLGLYDSVDLSTEVAHEEGLSGGALAVAVSPGSPASKIGLQPSDIITALDGQPVTSAGSLTALLSKSRPGSETTISFIQDGRPGAKTLILANQPADS